MANIFQDRMSILEQVQRIDPNGNASRIIEILNKTNPIFSEATAQMCNDTRSHVTSLRSNLGQDRIGVRDINNGADFYNSEVSNIRDETMLLETRIRLDEQIVESSPAPDELRMSEVIAGFEKLTQDFTYYVFYGDGAGPGTLKGLATRFNTLSQPNVWGAGGTSSAMTSLYIMQWGIPTVNLLYPKNSMVGISERDKGKHTVTGANGKSFEAYENIIGVHMGLSVPDYRAVQRVANLELTGSSNNLADETVWETVIDAIAQLPSMGQGAVCYVNRVTYGQIQKMCFNKSNAAFSYAEVSGQIVLYMFGLPVRMMEGVALDESQVS